MSAGHAHAPYAMPMGTTCAVHRHRELVPIERHHVWPLGEGGPDAPTNRIVVCANGHYSIHALLDLLLKNRGQLPWTVRRQYGPRVRQYARAGYEQITAHEGA